MRISDWSSDVCSSDLVAPVHPQPRLAAQAAHVTDRIAEPRRADAAPACGIFVRGDAHVELRLRVSPPFVHAHLVQPAAPDLRSDGATDEIGQASGRERVCQYV